MRRREKGLFNLTRHREFYQMAKGKRIEVAAIAGSLLLSSVGLSAAGVVVERSNPARCVRTVAGLRMSRQRANAG